MQRGELIGGLKLFKHGDFEVEFLHAEPNSSLSEVLRGLILHSEATTIAVGFATPDGLKLIGEAVSQRIDKLSRLIVGSATEKSLDTLESLEKQGAKPGSLLLHLGHSRETTSANARHPHFRYHPMMHAKIYYFEHASGNSTAIIGSHNLTNFAISGLNREFAVRIRGRRDHPEFAKLREFLTAIERESVRFDRKLKDAYSWWTVEGIDGLRRKIEDRIDGIELRYTFVVMASCDRPQEVRPGQVIYFDLPDKLSTYVRHAETHLYVFDRPLGGGDKEIGNLSQAVRKYRGALYGFEKASGGVELKANWSLNRETGELLPEPDSFRPDPPPDRQQIRTILLDEISRGYDYLFGRRYWEAVYSDEQVVSPPPDEVALLQELDGPPEDGEWRLITGFVPRERQVGPEMARAMEEVNVASQNYIQLSSHRHSEPIQRTMRYSR